MSTAQEPSELDRLFAECVESAGRTLAASGEFWPFALALTADGELVTPEIDPGEARPDPQQVIRLLRTALRAGSNTLVATAVCSDVKVSVDGVVSDALRVELEPRGADALTMTVPYVTSGERPQFSRPVGAADERRIWV